jgi:hypothetical protein
MNETRYHEEDFESYLQELIDHQRLEGAALGITKLVLNKGLDALSDRQKYVFDNQVIGKNFVEECERCASDIPWCEMLEATDNRGLCNYCAHMEEKLMKE